MKYTLLLALFLLCSRASSLAAAGDTTIIQGHNNVTIQTNPSVGSTQYSAWSEFPAVGTTPYRKVLAYLTFECAPGLNCGEWDYLNYLYIGRTGGVGGDSLGYELGRYITPYGNYWNSNDNWKHGWWLDITDWGYLLHDSVQIIYKHTGYEAQNDRGWRINLKYYVVEGTPVRNLVKMDTLWRGSFRYGDAANPIENRLTPRTLTLGANTKAARLWVMQTGHGSDDPDGCGEFCAKNRYVKWDGNTIDTRLMWKECGFNSLFPQAGTWLLDRANWCPGQTVHPDLIEIGGLTGSSTHTIDIDMQPYTATSNFGDQVLFSYLFEYGSANQAVDATLEAIMAPSTEYEFGRYNPVCGQPIVVISNNGSAPLTTLKIEYGPAGGTKTTYNWTGNLGFLQKDTVTLTQQQWALTQDADFEVELKNPNGGADGFIQDNKGRSRMKTTPVHPAGFVLEFRANKANQETAYKIIDAATGNTVHEKTYTDFPNQNAIYRDTVSLSKNTCYILVLSDEGTPLSGGIDINKDGLAFWYWDALVNSYPQYASYIDNNDGAFQIKSAVNNTTIKNFSASYTTQKGATISGSDFGTKIIYHFTTDNTNPVSAGTVASSKAEVSIYPNPSETGYTHIDYHLPGNKLADVEVTDVQGKVLLRNVLPGEKGGLQLDLRTLAKGTYLVRISGQGQSIVRKLVLR